MKSLLLRGLVWVGATIFIWTAILLFLLSLAAPDAPHVNVFDVLEAMQS